MEADYPYAIKNQRGASKIPLVGGILRTKAPSRGLWMPELVLYGIRLLAQLCTWNSPRHRGGPDIQCFPHGLRTIYNVTWRSVWQLVAIVTVLFIITQERLELTKKKLLSPFHAAMLQDVLLCRLRLEHNVERERLQGSLRLVNLRSSNMKKSSQQIFRVEN